MSKTVTVERPSPVNRFAPPATLVLAILRVTRRYVVVCEPTQGQAIAVARRYGFSVPSGGEAYFDRADGPQGGRGLKAPRGGDRTRPRAGGDWSDWRLSVASWSAWSVEGPDRESRMQAEHGRGGHGKGQES